MLGSACGRQRSRIFLMLVMAGTMGLLPGSGASPAEAQILNRLRRKAEGVLGETALIQRLLEEPPGITTSIRDAHTEVPFLDGYDPKGSADMVGLPRDSQNAFFAPPGLYEMEAWSYCIHAGTYGPTQGEGYALAPLQGELASVLRDLVRRSIDHPEISQGDIQALIWALQARMPIDEMSPELRYAANILLTSRQVENLSEGFVDLAKEELLEQARGQMPDAVRRVAEAEANLRSLFREEAAFEELEETAVLLGSPPLDELVREVPDLRWNYHPDGYFIRFDPRDYTLTYVQAYVPEEYLLGRDGEGRITEVMGPQDIRILFDYGETPGDAGGKLGMLRGAHLMRGTRTIGEWKMDTWTFVGGSLLDRVPGGAVAQAELQARRDDAREVRRQAREVIASALGRDQGRPGLDLSDLSNLRMALQAAGAPEDLLHHISNAWQFELCHEAGGCSPTRVGWRGLPAGELAQPNVHGPAVGRLSGVETSPTLLFRRAGGTSIDPGGNVAAPGNTGSQRLLQSGKSPVEKANAAMKAMGFFLALADVIGSAGNLGQMAYNALGMGGLPVGHLGLPTMMAGAMISQVVDAWSSATDALAGDTGGGSPGGDSGGDPGGGDAGFEGGGDSGWSGGVDPGGKGDPGDTDRSQFRSDGSDFENTPPPNPPPNPSPPPPGGGGGGGGEVSPERSEALNDFSESILGTLHHTLGAVDSEARRNAACEAGNQEWARRQAELLGHHRRQAALGMLETGRRIDELLAVAEAQGILESSYAYPEDFEAAQARLAGQGWNAEEMGVARSLGITSGEMESLRQRFLGLEAEALEGDLQESVRLWAKELRTAGYLWLALPTPSRTCPGG